VNSSPFIILGKHVAIKVQNLNELSTNEKDVNEEYRVLRDLPSHPNIPEFYGAFKNGCELWFVMEVRRVMYKYLTKIYRSRPIEVE